MTKPSFESLDETSDQLLTCKTVFLIALTSGKRRAKSMPLNMPEYNGPVIHIKEQGQGPEICMLSCTIPTLNHHLSNGMAEDRLLFPIWALRFYLERSMPSKEHKHLLFVSLKPGHKRHIVPSTISRWIWKQFWRATQIPLHLSLSPTRLRHNRYDPWLHHLHSTDRTPWNRFCELIPDAVITPSPTFISRTYLSILPISFN